MIKLFFSTDSSYGEMTAKYTKTDGLLALALYAVLMAAYYLMGVLLVQKNLYLGVPLNLLMIILCIVFALVRKQGLKSIGITTKNIGRALLTGAVLGVIISLSEEVVFRGYIQTRIYGLIKHDILAVLITAFLFYFMHLPFQIPVNGMQINLVNMAVMVALHFVMNFLYRKFNSLAAPTIFHGFLDWGGNLLR